jgi:hypothetical protein
MRRTSSFSAWHFSNMACSFSAWHFSNMVRQEAVINAVAGWTNA